MCISALRVCCRAAGTKPNKKAETGKSIDNAKQSALCGRGLCPLLLCVVHLRVALRKRAEPTEVDAEPTEVDKSVVGHINVDA